MRFSILITLLLGAAPVILADAAPALKGELRSRPSKLAYEHVTADGIAPVRIYNFTDSRQGFALYAGDELLGYSPEGRFDIDAAPPALVAMLDALPASAAREETGAWTPVAPLKNARGYVMWNQDSPFNDLCPEWQLGSRAPSGCVATAMAQVMFYHQWPLHGTGSHTYSPAVMVGNTLTADFGNTEYRWDAMLPYYDKNSTDKESREAVAELMLHCGVAVDMFYYSQSGATDYDVPPALVNYFGYDRGMAYRKREHYSSTQWLSVIHDELEAGRPILAYGKSSSGGHAFVFDGMDADGFIHVNWGWGGMSNGYFNTSVLTPPVQGIGGADGGFNYSQRIITGIRPADAEPGDYHVEITSTETLSTGRKKIAQGDEVKVKLAGKVQNHGWRDAEFDYALLLTDPDGNVVKVVEGPKGNSLAMNATAYAPDFGNVSFGSLDPGEYTLAPAVRASDATGEWIPVRDEYIGYPNVLKVTATDSDIAFETYDYFDLKAVETAVPEVIWSDVPALITTEVLNEGDVEYHGEIRTAIFDGKTEVASTSNYLIDLVPGESTEIRFTDAFSVAAGEYTLAFVNDDGQKICSPLPVTVKEISRLGNVSSEREPEVTEASSEMVRAKAFVKADAMFQGLLYAFIYDRNGNVQQGCLYPEYISIDDAETHEVLLQGEFENGAPGETYSMQLAVYSRNAYTFLKDDPSTVLFTLKGESGIESVDADAEEGYRYYDFNGFEVDPKTTKLCKKAKIRNTSK